MNLLKTLFISILLVLCDYTIVADSGSQSGGPNKDIVLRPGGGTSSRPKAASIQQVSCLYVDEYIYIEFLIPEGICEFSLMNPATGEVVDNTFDSENPEPIYVGELSAAMITVTTGAGNVYQGGW